MKSFVVLLCLCGCHLAVRRAAAATLFYSNGVNAADVDNGRVNDPQFGLGLTHGDSFVLPESGSIEQLQWLGAYKDGNNYLPDGPDDFTVTLYQFIGATPSATPFATLTLGNVTRQMAAVPVLSNGSQVFSYSATFPGVSVPAGTWLISIMNNPADTDLWLWGSRDQGQGQSWSKMDSTAWREFSGGGVAEFAFGFTGVTVPEPCTALFLTSGLLWFCGNRIRPPGTARSRD